MGRKSRLKRERRIKNAATDPASLMREFHAFHRRAVPSTEMAFQERLKEMRTLLREYRHADVAIALSLSDLWPRNAASPIKHIFAWAVFLSMEKSSPDSKPIDSYNEFVDFARSMYAVCPEFPSLEDFSPEADWGQVRVRLGADFVPILYGGCIERTPDFIEAFRITYAHVPDALAVMDFAVATQAYIIEAVPELRSAKVEELSSGYVEVPPQFFWEACRPALLQIGRALGEWRQRAGRVLETTFGAIKPPTTWNSFGGAVMEGSVLPFLGVVDGESWFPISARNMPGTVIDHWAAKHPVGVSLKAHRMLARFIGERFRGTLIGPMTLFAADAACTELPVSCVLTTNAGVYLVCATDHASNDRAAQAASAVYGKVRQGAQIYVQSANGRLLISKDGASGLGVNELRILLVVTQSSTAFGSVNLPTEPARLLPLGDLVTIFDSLEDLTELDSFFRYVDEQKGALSPFSTGPADLFASFRDSHGVLVDGASNPTFVMLAPNWGTSWRFQELCRFWSRAPRVFPDGSPGWRLEEGTDGVVSMMSRHHQAIAYSTVVGGCTLQTQVVITESVGVEEGRMADLFAQILADSSSRCRELINDAPLFAEAHVVLGCEPDPACLIEEDKGPEAIGVYKRIVISAKRELVDPAQFHITIDARAILAGLVESTNSAFEIRCLTETLAACHAAYGVDLPKEVVERVSVRTEEPARYSVEISNRYIDVPDYVDPIVPSPTDYKLARKRLALTLKELNLAPGRYELADAKQRIDAASVSLRAFIEGRLASLDRSGLIKCCIEQHDALLIAEKQKIQRARQSLSHQVEYDRIDAVETARKEYGSVARHYRYVLEKLVSTALSGTGQVDSAVLKELIGLVDWYMVMTGASDVLHNEVDVGGVEIDDSFVPQVFYSAAADSHEELFAKEYAKSRLGLGINEADAVDGASFELLEAQHVRDAFLADVGFELSHLVSTLMVLSQAKRHGFGDHLALSYSAEPDRIAEVVANNVDGLQRDVARKIVEFLTLSETGVRRLPGRDVDEIDVPYWEHRKRIHRYAIRPLIGEDARVRWGAEQTSRAMNIWMSSVRDGYLPADFTWPTVEPVIRAIKEGIERELEVRAEEVFRRYTPYVVRGVDFFRRFRGGGFEDVGDFDVLAYWPGENMLVAVECKYNQPAYTVKDGRRLRDRIFGKSETDRAGQYSRIARRRDFIAQHRSKLIALLKWPGSEQMVVRDFELYVGREIYYWMHAPYPVSTEFVRVDALDAWIASKFEAPRLSN